MSNSPVYEIYGLKQTQEWLGHSGPATTPKRCVRLTRASRAKAVLFQPKVLLRAMCIGL